MLRVVKPVSSLIFASVSSSPSHPANTKPGTSPAARLDSIWAFSSSNVSMFVYSLALRFSRAVSKRRTCMSSNAFGTKSMISSKDTATLSERSRIFTMTWLFSISRGPNSMRIGTPFSSHSLNLKPGELSLSSKRTRIPAAFKSFCNTSRRSTISGFFFHGPTGIKTTCFAATLGGKTNPWSSP